jgi:phage/plasmid-like protein (TIGR03299 family)
MPDYYDKGIAVRKPSWHGKETLLQEYPLNWEHGRELAGLTWEPEAFPLFRKVTKLVPVREFALTGGGEGAVAASAAEYLDGEWVQRVEVFETANAQEIRRNDTGDVLADSVSGKFELLLHEQMGPIIEAILDQPNVKYDTIFSVRGGRQVAVCVLLDEPVQIKGDNSMYLTYLVILNSHDGTGACKVLFTTVRVVCANTIAKADREGDRTGVQFSFRHTTGMADRIAQAKDALQGARDATLEWVGIAEQLALTPFSIEKRNQFVDAFIPMPPAGTSTVRVLNNVEQARSKLHVLFASRTNRDQAHTALGVVNAAVEYLDHVRAYRSSGSYIGRQLLNPETQKARAIKLVRELASV